MTIYYSKSAQGFFDSEIVYPNIPDDCKEISNDLYKSLLDGQSLGKIISCDVNGIPILVDPPQETKEEFNEKQKQKRKVAYQQESDCLFFEWQAGECTKDVWTNKRNEIKERFGYQNDK